MLCVRPSSIGNGVRSAGAPLLLGLLIFLFGTVRIAYQDVVSLLGADATGLSRGNAYLEAPAGSSVHSRTSPYVATLPQGKAPRQAAAPAAVVSPTFTGTPDGPRIVVAKPPAANLAAPPGRLPAPRVNRAAKGDLMMTRSLPPSRGFSPPIAGSVFSMSSLVEKGGVGRLPALSFNGSVAIGREVMTAAADFGPPVALVAALAAPPSLAGAAERVSDQHMAFMAIPRKKPRIRYAGYLTALAEVGMIPPLNEGQQRISSLLVPEKERRCLATGIYFEARGETIDGQVAVAQVILNRVRNKYYPNTICGVVYQNRSWRNRCQFSFACDGRRDRIRDMTAWKRARKIADDVITGARYVAGVGTATHYHAAYVNPRWSRFLLRMKKVGRHIFYRGRKGGWS